MNGESVNNESANNERSTTFETKEIDVSLNRCCWIVCFPFTCGINPYSTILILDSEEVTKIDVNLCGKSVSKRPYGELGSVDRIKFLCCVELTSSFGNISPGCGCDGPKVDDVVLELKKRMRGRGDTAQIQRAEETLERLDVIENKLDLVLKKLELLESSSAVSSPNAIEMEDR